MKQFKVDLCFQGASDAMESQGDFPCGNKDKLTQM